MPLFRNIGVTLEMIKWEHSVLTLPFGLTGAVLAARGLPSVRQCVWLVVALVAGRSAAMAFNRLADAHLDSGNPRTSMRALPAGLLSRRFVFWFVVFFSLLLVYAARELSQLAFYLSPVALAILFGYSYTKRFTRWAHLVLGLAMGVAPAAAWVAVRGSFDPRILIVTAAVMFWGGGFDILYACQDYDYDCRAGLYSIPRFFGIGGALLLARFFHMAAFGLFLAMIFAFHLGWIALAAVLLVGALLIYEHRLVRANDLSRINAAFFTMNGLISMLLFVLIASDLLLLG